MAKEYRRDLCKFIGDQVSRYYTQRENDILEYIKTFIDSKPISDRSKELWYGHINMTLLE